MLVLLAAAPCAIAQGRVLTVDLAQDHVDITTGFNGAQLVLFGVQEQEGDIAIVITGPRRDMVVRQKKRVFGVWTNLYGLRLKDVPGFYRFAIGPEEGALLSSGVLKEAGIGMEALRFVPKREYKDKDKLKKFQDALIRNMQAEGMFPVRSGELVFLNDHFFRTTFYLPANVPTGSYKVQTFLMRGGKVVSVNDTAVKVAQVGTSARIYRFAHGRSLTYGLLCVMFAMAIGWFSNSLRLRQ